MNQQPSSGGSQQQGAGMLAGAQTDELRDILPPVEVPFWTPGWIALAALLGAICLVLLVWGIVLMLRRKSPQMPLPTPQEEALQALQRLKGAEGMALSSRDFAAEIAAVLRRFLEAVYGIRATRQTADEFLAALEADPKFDPEERGQLRRFLSRCDQLKFGGEEAEREGREGLIWIVEERIKGGRA
ncbi:MAG: DUF4381 domain-containing protein [Verrucomicrobiota bacterium]